MDTLFQTDYEIHKAVYGVGSNKEYMVNNGTNLVWVDENGVEVKAYSGVFRAKT